ncbi:hypothetical protein GCM10017635_05020 [Paracoccus kondratievae]|uniref:Uncharacterized protein n=1 Tax=Paracoccus kondratievae TaxID=135740 RepID=A0AAD3NXF6_9RHOB|nr:hypothetical protein GCM10017635_05020 [Paracoccus kondratievae]
MAPTDRGLGPLCFRGLSEAERGMLIVETIAKIRRLHFTEGKGIKTICRDLKLSKSEA